MPWVLLTSFHSVRLCMEILEKEPPQNMPVFTLVVCNPRKEGQYRRATKLVDSMSVPIYVCRETCAQSMVAGMLGPLNCLLTKNTKPTLLPPSVDQNAWPQLACHISDHHAIGSVQQREEHGDEDAKVIRLMQACWESCAAQLCGHDPSRTYAGIEEQCWLRTEGGLPAMPVQLESHFGVELHKHL